MDIAEIQYSPDGKHMSIKYKDTLEVQQLKAKIAKQKKVIEVLWQDRKNKMVKSKLD